MMPSQRDSIADLAQRYRVHLSFAVLFVFAVFFRFYDLDSLPPFLDIDEAVNGSKAQLALFTGNFQFFYKVDSLIMHNEPFAHEGLFVNLIALSFSIFGQSPWAIRLVSALIGVGTVLGLFLAARVFFSSSVDESGLVAPSCSGGAASLKIFRSNGEADGAAFVAALLLAVSLWHTLFSRIGFNATLTPVVYIFSFFFLFRAFFKGSKMLDFLLSGFFLGLSFHTYLSNRVLPFLVVAFMLLVFVERRSGEPRASSEPRLLPRIVLFWVVWFVVASPILYYFYQNPADFSSRAKDLSIYDSAGWFSLLIKNFFITLGQFNFKGDPFLRHNLPGATALLWPVGIFFIIGVFISLFNSFLFFTRLARRCAIEKGLCLYPFLIIWLLVTLAPAFLSDGPHPHAHRSLNAVLPAHLLAGLGAVSIYLFLKRSLRVGGKAIMASAIIALLLISVAEYRRYFHEWASQPHLGAHFSENLFAIAGFLNSLPPETKKIVVVNFYGPQPVQFLTDTYIEEKRAPKNLRYLKPGEKIDIDFRNERPYVVVPLERDKKVYSLLQRHVPGRFVSTEHFDYILME